MKNFRKLASMLLALVLILSMTAVAAVADEVGSITINGVSAEGTYSIYRLLDLESYDTESGAYSYKVNSAWTGFFATDEAKKYMSVDSQGYATWTNASEADAIVAAFAKAALAYAKENGIEPVQSSANEGEFVITEGAGKFSDLTLGYYLVDSTMGALCGLTTTNPDASINAKNKKPTIDKQVQEDSLTNEHGEGGWGDSNTADIGQTVNFQSVIDITSAGAENLVVHDVMSAGLTFDKVTKIEHVVPGTGTHVVSTEQYTVTTDLEDDCTFEITFSKEVCDELEMNDKIVIHYSAMLNRNAIVADEGNPNKTRLEYGEENFTEWDQTVTYTFGLDIVKTDSQNKLIDGAGFRIYDAETGGNEVKVVLMEDGETYRRARSDEEGVEIMVENGLVKVVGFDNGTYYLQETTTPAGYNQLSSRQKFIISNANLDSVFNGDIYSTGSGVHVVNKSGTMLPETGGIGTTIFYIVGGTLVAAAVVMLITKKRMSYEA